MQLCHIDVIVHIISNPIKGLEKKYKTTLISIILFVIV